MKPQVVVIYDQDGWSFHHIAQQIERHLSDEYDVTICSHHSPDKKALAKADAAICLWYGTVCNLHQGTPYFAPWQERVAPEHCKQIACCFDESLRWKSGTGWANEETITFALQHSDAFLCSSDGMIRRMFPYFSQPKHLGTCKDGVDLDLFPHHPYRSIALEDGDPVDDLHDKDTPLRVGWVGNTEVFGDLKGVGLIKEACEGVPGITFIHRDREEHGLLPHDKMHQYYGMMDVLVCMSSVEGTPNPILEASATGRAWISTDVGIVSEINEDARRVGCKAPPGLIIPRQVSALRQAVIKLRDNRGLLETMGAVGRYVIEKRWQWGDKAEQYRDALHAVGVWGNDKLAKTVYRQKREPTHFVKQLASSREVFVFVSDLKTADRESIEQLKKQQREPVLCFTVTKQNIMQIPQMIELSADLECKCSLSELLPNGNKEDFLHRGLLADHVENELWLKKFKDHPQAWCVERWPVLIQRKYI
jgi:hypothetical protein